jgi:hypothetical protein
MNFFNYRHAANTLGAIEYPILFIHKFYTSRNRTYQLN